MNNIVATLIVILGTIVLLCFLLFFGAVVATWLWGVIMVPVFGLPALGYWQMFGLMWLLRLLFGTSKISTSRRK